MMDDIQIRQNDIFSISSPTQQYQQIYSEMTNLIHQSPNMKLLFMNKFSQDSLTRFCTWLMMVVNHLDNPTSHPHCVDSNELVYTIPTLYTDIPFETFRAFMRARQNQNFESQEDLNRVYIGCLQGNTF